MDDCNRKAKVQAEGQAQIQPSTGNPEELLLHLSLTQKPLHMKQETPLILLNVYGWLSAFSSPFSRGGQVLLGSELKFSTFEGHQRALISFRVCGDLACALCHVQFYTGSWYLGHHLANSLILCKYGWKGRNSSAWHALTTTDF